MSQLLECVPNFSEGRDPAVIRLITDEIQSVEGVKLLNVDPGKATNRTVVTMVGAPEAVLEAAFRAIKKAGEVIDMSRHHGEHPRMGATDVCPLIPVAGLTMEQTAAYAVRLAERVGRELNLPVYLYEAAQPNPARRNLSVIRAGEYEGFAKKITLPEWAPDHGPAVFDAKRGATVIGARDFLVAYNVNLNTTSTRRANAVAFDVREAGRPKKDAAGKVVKDAAGKPLTLPGTLKCVKAIGWFIEEYGIAQVSINLTNLSVTPLHVAFDEVCRAADARGLRVTGSELVGLIPLQSLLDAGRYFLRKQKRSVGVAEKELVRLAVRSLGLDELSPFKPEERVIEYVLRDASAGRLVQMDLRAFAEETASESPAPGGGSISAYLGALGAALGTMVANLSSHKPSWDERWEEFSDWAVKGQRLKDELLALVDEDTVAFSRIMTAFGLPKGSEAEKAARTAEIQAATRVATEVPFRVMQVSAEALPLALAMVEKGNPNSISDAGVGALSACAAVRGAYLNVRINAKGLTDREFADRLVREGAAIEQRALELERQTLAAVVATMSTG
ncbi:MAG: glutamate formimidoyltransferase [Candidatus Didemnitutus sp.]|nr:glutamate formimidoyltransferase [Candidatus Didemnitutus sp.]